MLSKFFLFGALLSGGAIASLQIVPGATWTAAGTNAHMQAHGGGIIQVGSTYYLIGEDHTAGSAFQAVNCYSSQDLTSWTFVNKLLTVQSSGDLGPSRVVERPKVIYNSATSTYVMWMHIDSSSYGEAKVGVATSSSVCGTYTYINSFQPLGYQSRDIGLYKDTDNTAYLLTEDRVNGLRINKLSSDYLTVDSATYLFPAHYESPAIYKSGSTYFMFASHLTGWSTNDNQYSTATSLSGPWSDWANFATTGSNTFNSQTTFILGVGNSILYMGDRWVSTNLGSSTYVWLPLIISGQTASLTNQVNWILSVSAGTWTAGPTETTPEAESSSQVLAASASIIACSACSGTKAVGYLGGSTGGSVTFPNISFTGKTGTPTTIRIKYNNGDAAERFATVTVNGVSQIIGAVYTGGQTGVWSSTLHTTSLIEGTTNVIKIEGVNGAWAPDIDRMMVPAS